MTWQPIEYGEGAGTIVLPKGTPFDGEPVLILLSQGVVEARWMDWVSQPSLEDPYDGEGWCWVCLDDSALAAELHDATHWMPLPEAPHD